MGEIDRQRISAVKKLHELGLAWHAGTWRKAGSTDLTAEADTMHALLVRRADNLEGCSEGSPEHAELASIVDAIGAYEEKRWPFGKIPGGKGLALQCATYTRPTRSGTCWPATFVSRTIEARRSSRRRGSSPATLRPSDGEREIALMSWGFVLLQNGRAPRRVTNVRDDKILESRFWRGSFEERRCLVPATASPAAT